MIVVGCFSLTGLPPEFEAVIATSIHEQVLNYREVRNAIQIW